MGVRSAGERPRPVGNRPTMLGDCLLGERLGSPSLKLSDAARTLRGIEQLLWSRHRGPCVTDEAGAYLDTCLPFLAALARERGQTFEWARPWAEQFVPALAAQRSEIYWRACERRASERRRGSGLSADDIAVGLSIHEAELETCFDTGRRNKRGRYGLVSVERPAHVRRAEHEAARERRKKAKRMRRAAYEAQAKADQHEAERLGISYAAARKRRQRLSQVSPAPMSQVRPQTQGPHNEVSKTPKAHT